MRWSPFLPETIKNKPIAVYWANSNSGKSDEAFDANIALLHKLLRNG